MSFLGRRKSSRPFPDSANNVDEVTPADSNKHKQTPSVKSTSTLRHRLSSFSLLGPKRTPSSSSKTKGISGGVGYVSPYRVREHVPSRSPSPTSSVEDIRRPSGLGRRVSLTGQIPEEPWEPSWQRRTTRISRMGSQRKHSASTPELALFVPETLGRWAELSETETTTEDEHAREAPCMFTRIQSDLLKTVFAFAAAPDLASLTRVCKSFVSAARTVLYQDVDLVSVTSPARVEHCFHILASRRDLAGLVKRLACSSIPIGSEPTTSSSPLPAVTFAIALSNMSNLLSLTLPRFDPSFFFHTSFQLRSLTLLWETASIETLQSMFAWLASQPTLKSLSFPHLILPNDSSSVFAGAGSHIQHSTIGALASSAQPSLFVDTLHLLPRLERIGGPAHLVAALVPERPVKAIALHIHATLYDGFKPSALMAELARGTTAVTELAVVTTPQIRIDARTLERTLMAAGAELGVALRVLEIRSTLDDDLLYKQIQGILPRYMILHTLRLRRSFSPSYLTPPPTPSPTQHQPETPTPYRSARTRSNTALPVRTQERALLGMWSRHCYTLRDVLFLPGGHWRISEGLGGAIYNYLGNEGS